MIEKHILCRENGRIFRLGFVKNMADQLCTTSKPKIVLFFHLRPSIRKFYYHILRLMSFLMLFMHLLPIQKKISKLYSGYDQLSLKICANKSQLRFLLIVESSDSKSIWITLMIPLKVMSKIFYKLSILFGKFHCTHGLMLAFQKFQSLYEHQLIIKAID